MNTELNFPRRLLAGLTALALLLMLALPVWAEGEETEKLPVSINSVEDLLQLVADCRLDSWSEDRTVDLNTDLDLTGVDFAGIPTFSGTFDGNSHTISGLSLVDDGSVTGFFRYIQDDGVVHDLTIRGRSMPSGSRTTVLVRAFSHSYIRSTTPSPFSACLTVSKTTFLGSTAA